MLSRSDRGNCGNDTKESLGRSTARRFTAQFIAAALLAALSPLTARAQSNLYWDPNNATSPGTDGSANWDTASTFWSTIATGGAPDQAWNNTSGYTANFGYSGDSSSNTWTVTLITGITAAGIDFNTDPGAFTFAGTGSPTLTLGSGGIIVASGDGTETFGNSLAIALGAGQSWTNGSTAGTLTINSNVTSSATSGTQLLTIAGNTTIAGNITNGATGGTIALTQSAGNLLLSGANGYTGATAVTGGALIIQSNSALGTATATMTSGVTVSSGAELQIQGGITTTTAVGLTLNGTGLTTNGALENVSGTNTYSGLIQLGSNATIGSDAGTLTLSNAGTIFGASSNLGLTLTGAGNGVLAGIWNGGVNGTAGAGTLTMNGSGTWTLSGTSTYTGATTINSGSLVAGAGAAATGLSSSTPVLLGNTSGSSAATLQLGSTTAYTNNITLQSGNSGLMTLNGSGNITLNGSVTLGTASSTGQSLTLAETGSAASTFRLGGVIQDPTGLSGSPGTVTIGSGNVGTVIFTGTNTYTGTTRISGGTLQVGSAGTTGQVGNGTSPIVNSASLVIDRTDAAAAYAFANPVSGNGTLTINGGGYLTLTGANSYTGITTITNGSALSVTNVINELGPDPSSFVANQLSFTGSGGSLVNMPVGQTTGFSLTIDANRGIFVGSGATATFRTGYSNVNDTINSVISGAGNIAKTDTSSDSLILNAANTFTGTTSWNTVGGQAQAGLIQLGNALALQFSTINENATAGGNLTFNNANSGGSSYTIGGLMGTVNQPLTDVSSAAVALSVGNNNANTSYSGALTGGGSLTKIGTGSLTLTGNSSYGGGTTISNGILIVANTTGSATGTAGIALNAGTLASGTVGTISGTVTGATTANTISPGGTGTAGTLAVGGLTTGSGTVLQFDTAVPNAAESPTG